MTKSSYTVTLFLNLAHRVGIKHPSGTISHRSFRTFREAVRFCKSEGLGFVIHD